MGAVAKATEADVRAVTVVIGVGVESVASERALNLTASLRALAHQTLPKDQYRLVIVEQGTEPRLEATVRPAADDYIFAFNPGPFNRSWGLNVGAMTASSGVVCTFDADLIVQPDFLRRGLLAWRVGALAIKPFTEILYMNPDSTSVVREQLANGEQVDCYDARYRGDLHPWSKGGCIWVDALLYHRLGGHDERFAGWGEEDREFWQRLSDVTSIVTLSGRLLHLYHARDVEAQPEVVANYRLHRVLKAGLLPAQRRRVGDALRYRRQRHGSTTARRGADVLKAAKALCRGEKSGDIEESVRLHVAGLLAAGKGHHHVALACLTRAAALAPSEPRYFVDLGRVLRAQHRYADALSVHLRAATLAPDDAAVYGELACTLRDGGWLREAAVMFSEAFQLDPTRALTLGELGDVLRRLGRLDEALKACDIAQHFHSETPIGYLRLGQVHASRHEWDLALDAFKQGLRATLTTRTRTTSRDSGFGQPGDQDEGDRERASLHTAIGDVLSHTGSTEAAIAAFRTALTFNPKDVHACRRLAVALESTGRMDDAAGAWVGLGVALEDERAFEEAAAAYRRAIARKRDGLKAHINLTRVESLLGHTDAAVHHIRTALAIDPSDPVVHTELGRLSLLLGDVDRGWTEFAWFCHPQRSSGRMFEQPIWDGSPLEGRTILVWADQELGDTIHWLRYLPFVHAQGGRIIVECQPRIVPLITHLAGVSLVVGRHAPLPPFDTHVPLTLLPVICPAARRPIPWHGPYLSVDRGLAELWRQRLTRDRSAPTRELIVGVSWAGHPDGINGAFRFASLEAFASLGGLCRVRFVSLQMGSAARELQSQRPGFRVEHLQGDDCSMADTAALMLCLDLVITVDTMVAHLAGALGRPVWLALPYVADWRWEQETSRSPLYPTMRLFRQARPGDWTAVLQEVRAELVGLQSSRAFHRADATRPTSRNLEHKKGDGLA